MAGVSQEYIEAVVFFGSLPNPANASLTNLETLQAKFLTLFAQVEAGQGSVVVNVSIPGQSISRKVPLTIADQLAAYMQAIDILTNNRQTVTFARFF